MPFEFKKTEIEGLMLIKPHMYPDERGLYKKYYEKNIFALCCIIGCSILREL